MTEPLSNLSIPKLKKAAKIDTSADSYSKIIEAIKADPSVMLDPTRVDELASLKLFIPERIRSLKYARRQVSLQLEEILDEIKARDVEIALSVREQRDSVTSKPLYTNPQVRLAEELKRRASDSTYQGLLSARRKTFSILYGYDEEIEYLERIDISLLEIIALTTTQLELHSKHVIRRSNYKPARNLRRSNPQVSQPAIPESFSDGAGATGTGAINIGGDDPSELS